MRFVSRLRHRGRIVAKQASLSFRRWRTGRPFWVDYGCIKLPFHGDGDRQEIYYHLDGKDWWSKELQLISGHLNPGDVVVDVGANLGFLSGLFSTLTGPAGQVYSFEPSPIVYAKLLEVIAANNYTNVSAYNMGLRQR